VLQVGVAKKAAHAKGGHLGQEGASWGLRAAQITCLEGDVIGVAFDQGDMPTKLKFYHNGTPRRAHVRADLEDKPFLERGSMNEHARTCAAHSGLASRCPAPRAVTRAQNAAGNALLEHTIEGIRGEVCARVRAAASRGSMSAGRGSAEAGAVLQVYPAVSVSDNASLLCEFDGENGFIYPPPAGFSGVITCRSLM
jgi:hypothetical protein